MTHICVTWCWVQFPSDAACVGHYGHSFAALLG